MVFEERIFDFGKIKKGEKREHTFEFTNKGTEPLVIELISACDCTTTEYSTKPVRQGEKGKIHIIFDSSEKDEAEIIDIDIILENIDPKNNVQIFEQIQYKFDIEK